MLNDLLHLDEGHTLITASTVGIPLADWISLEAETATSDAALTLMHRHKLDVVPLIAKDGHAYEFYSKLPGSNSAPSRQPILYNSTLPSNTHIKDVIKSFSTTNRRFFFLRNKGDIGGLVTLSDLNNRQVKTYLYGLLCDLESDLSQYVRRNIEQETILKMLQATADRHTHGSLEDEVLDRYNRDADGDLQIHITEYLYLSHLFELIAANRLLDEHLRYARSSWTEMGKGVKDLRNKVAHPVKPLLQKSGDLDWLHQQLDSIYDLNFRLRYWSGTQPG